MAKITRWLRKWWWLLVIGAGVALAVLWHVFGPRRAGPPPPMQMPKLLDLARDKVEKIHLEGEVEKAKIRAVADEQRKQIAAIEDKGKADPAAARAELAAWLGKNL